MTTMSMTGFGSATFQVEGGHGYRVEIRSVNHKSFNLRFRAPSEFSPVETAAIKQAKKALLRGAVDVTLQRDGATAQPVEINVNRDGASQLMKALQDLAWDIGAPEPTLELVLRHGDFVEVRAQQAEPAALGAGLTAGLERALEELLEARRAEGSHLAADIEQRVQLLVELLAHIETSAPAVYEAFRARLDKRLADAAASLGVELDEGRLAAELVVFSDRSDVTEEIVRARTHLVRFAEILESDETETGRRLEFLLQELVREFNTIGSKCRDAGMAEAVVQSKVELEKIREQVQNIA